MNVREHHKQNIVQFIVDFFIQTLRNYTTEAQNSAVLSQDTR